MHANLMRVVACLCLSAGVLRDSPIAEELLDKYTQALDSIQSIIVKAEIVTQHEYRFSRNWHEPGFRGVRDKGTSYQRQEFRTDGRRFHWRAYQWGHINRQDRSVPEARPYYNCLNYARGKLYSHNARVDPKLPGGVVKVNERPNFQLPHFLRGYDIQSDDRLDSILCSAKTLSVRPTTVTIGGFACYVIDARTDCGAISVWLDPAHGWHTARIEAKARQGDIYWGKPLSPGQVVSSCMENVRFEQVDALWVPMEADLGMENHYGRGSFSSANRHYKRAEVAVNPDHDALGSFDSPLENPRNDPELKDGTSVRMDGSRYVWQNGKLVPDGSRSRSTQRRPPARK
jgi:hypothetical protein